MLNISGFPLKERGHLNISRGGQELPTDTSERCHGGLVSITCRSVTHAHTRQRRHRVNTQSPPVAQGHSWHAHTRGDADQRVLCCNPSTRSTATGVHTHTHTQASARARTLAQGGQVNISQSAFYQNANMFI